MARKHDNKSKRQLTRRNVLFLLCVAVILVALTGCKPSPFQCNIEADSLHFVVAGETGPASLNAQRTRGFSPGKQTISLDDTLTYQNSKNSYHITGEIVIEKDSITSYELTATGGLFGDKAQVCKGP